MKIFALSLFLFVVLVLFLRWLAFKYFDYCDRKKANVVDIVHKEYVTKIDMSKDKIDWEHNGMDHFI